MAMLFRTTPVLRRRAAYQAGLFSAFSLFWTTVPLYLAGPAFNLSQRASRSSPWLVSPERLRRRSPGASPTGAGADRSTVVAIVSVAVAFIMTHIGTARLDPGAGAAGRRGDRPRFRRAGELVAGQRTIFSLGAEFRARLNGIYMAIFFAGGAMGSALGAWAYAQGGWMMASSVGLALPVMALLYYTTERRAG